MLFIPGARKWSHQKGPNRVQGTGLHCCDQCKPTVIDHCCEMMFTGHTGGEPAAAMPRPANHRNTGMFTRLAVVLGHKTVCNPNI